MASHIERRKFLATLGGATAAWPIAARGQQPAMPTVTLVRGRSANASARHATAFRKGLNETGYVEGQSVMVESHWLDGRYDRLPSLIADFVSRPVAVIATTGPTAAAQAAIVTAKNRYARALAAVAAWCRFNRHQPIPDQHAHLTAMMRGHYAYYGITGNSRRLSWYAYQVARIWQKWLSRRDRGSRLQWRRFIALLKRCPLPAPRIVHRYTTTSEALP